MERSLALFAPLLVTAVPVQCLAQAAPPAGKPEPVYSTYGVHNPAEDSPCTNPQCTYPKQPGRPTDPVYPVYWHSKWTMYQVFEYGAKLPAASLPPYKGPPPGLRPGKDYRISQGATYYDSTWRGGSGEGAMMEYYEDRCLPIFPGIENNFTCAFISLGDIAFFLTYDKDRPKGMPPICLFSPLNHPPRRDFIKHLPYSAQDSARLGGGAQAYSFWVGPDGKPVQVGVAPDRTNADPSKGAILFGYAFAPVDGQMQPQSFFFSGIPTDPPKAPFVAQVYSGFEATQPDPAKTWALVAGLNPDTLPKCTVMDGPPPPPTKGLAAAAPRPLTWFDLGRKRPQAH
ncbi:hypothetical protein [Sphingomonas sp.]|uniref:hypothetical protein n=1 Tax=Sphingomonas sp. TaxID=28214 RepID=UPI003B3AE5EB